MYIRLTTFFLCLIFIMAAPYKAIADTVFTIGFNTYQHDGKFIPLDVKPQVINNRTMVPVRYLAESCGADVEWDPASYTVSLKKDTNVIRLTIGSNKELINGNATIMDVTPVVVDGRTMLPARWVAEKLGYQVAWSEKNNTVTIFPQQAAIQSNSINVRTGPGLNYEVPGLLPQNTILNVKNTHGSPSQKMLSGLGVWTSIYKKLPSDYDIKRFSQAGIKRIYLEVATTYSGFPSEWQNWINVLAPVAHKAGIQVIGWVYVSLKNPESDMKLIEQVAGYKTPGGDRLDAVAADIEELPEDDISRSQVLVKEFSQVRYRVDCPLLAITYPPQIRPHYPYDTILNSFDGVVLMDYWHNDQRPYSKDEVIQFISQSVAALKQINSGVAIDLALEGCDIGAGMVTAEEMQGAVEGARSSGTGYSLYCYDTPDYSVWRAFTDNGAGPVLSYSP